MSRTILAIAALVLGALIACTEDEAPVAPPPTSKPPTYKDLSQRIHVLQNLEAAYDNRNDLEYKRLLDQDFIFFFSDEDFSAGRTPEQWGKEVDEAATTRLLKGELNKDGNRILSIDLDIEEEAAQWDTIPGGTGEDWYMATVNYSFTMRATNDLMYATTGQPEAEFTVRNAGTEESPLWKLVRWRDLYGTVKRGALTGAVESTPQGTLKKRH